MQFTIRETKENPFIKNPILKTLWPEFSSGVAQEYTAECIERGEEGIFEILLDDKVIGMTGFFDLESKNGKFYGLRWHGILPEYRKKGLSEYAIYMVALHLKERHPEVDHLVEYIPHTSYSAPIFKYFEKLGFEPYAKPETVDWAPHQIQAYGIEIKELLLAAHKKGMLSAIQVSDDEKSTNSKNKP